MYRIMYRFLVPGWSAKPVGAGNSAVVVDLPRCGPILSLCTESCTDSWSPDGARNPWSAPTTELWAPTPSQATTGSVASDFARRDPPRISPLLVRCSGLSEGSAHVRNPWSAPTTELWAPTRPRRVPPSRTAARQCTGTQACSRSRSPVIPVWQAWRRCPRGGQFRETKPAGR